MRRNFVTLFMPLVAAAVIANLPAAAQTGESELTEIVITATPLRRAGAETAQPATTLGGERLAIARQASLGETLAGEPGVTASAFGPIASRPIVRGQGGLRVQTYQDGADTLDVGALSDDHAVGVEPLLIERIEVIRGPAALLFGSAAAAGAINVITSRLPLQRPAADLLGGVELRGDTAAAGRSVAARLGGRLSEQLQFAADAHHFASSDLRIPGGRLANSAGESQSAGAGLGWSGERGAFALAASRLENRYGLPSDEEDISLALEQDRIDLGGEWQLGEIFDQLRLRAARSDYRHVELEGEEIGTRYEQIGTELRVSLERTDALVIGLQWRDLDFDAAGEEAFLPPSQTRSLGAFAFGAWQYGDLAFEAGGRIERQTLSADLATDRDYAKNAASASLGMIWRFTDSWDLTMQATSTGRHPTATELHADGPHIAVQRYEIGDERLGIETARTLDLGLHRRSATGWRGSLALFRADYDDFIGALPDGSEADGLPVVRFTAVAARFTGVELEWSHDALWTSSAGALGLRIFGDLVRARDAAGEPLPQIPPRRLGVEAGWSRGPWRWSVETLWHDAQTAVAAGERPTNGFTALSADLSYRIETGGAAILWYVRGANLLDEVMRRHTSPLKDIAPLAARHLSTGISLKF